MLDDIWTTRRWIVGAASFALVGVALAVGLLLGNDEGNEKAALAVAPAGGSADESPEHTAAGGNPPGDHSGSSDGSCGASGGPCRAGGQAPTGSRSAAGDEPDGSADPADDAAAEPELSEQEQARSDQSMEPNANPDHYGPGGEPRPQPSQPTAEGSRPELDSEPNHDPSH